MFYLNADYWQPAILEEYQSIQEGGTCRVHEMSYLPPGTQPVGTHWVYKLIHNADRSV